MIDFAITWPHYRRRTLNMPTHIASDQGLCDLWVMEQVGQHHRLRPRDVNAVGCLEWLPFRQRKKVKAADSNVS
jgi:hypothetical protein